MFIGMRRSKYHKRQGREANHFGKECASLLTLHRRLCGSFSYSKLAETYQTQLKEIGITSRFSKIGYFPTTLTSSSQT